MTAMFAVTAHTAMTIVVTALAALTTACGDGISPAAATPMEKPMTTPSQEPPSRSSSRVRAPTVAAVEYGGVRFEPLGAPSGEGLPPGVYVKASEIASGKRLWTARVWETVYDDRREADVQNVFLRRMTLDSQALELVVEDERGRKSRITIADGKVLPGR